MAGAPAASKMGGRLSGQPMSALGQKQTFAVQNVMSNLPSKADICGAVAHVRFRANSERGPLILRCRSKPGSIRRPSQQN